MIPLICISLNHKNAPVEVRKQFAFSAAEAHDFCDSLCNTESALHTSGAVIVSTCNRIELYVSLSDDESADAETIPALQQRIADAKGESRRIFRKYCHSFVGEDAIRHLFAVASGLDSMVLGENEILGQLRESYKRAAAAHHTDFLLHTVFQRALSCAKRVKTETNLSKATESIATLAVKEILSFANGKPVNVLVIGASGETGSLLVRDLAEKRGVQVFATVRHHYPLQELAQVQKIAYDERYSYFDCADVIVSATKSPHYTVTYEETVHALRTAKPRLFIDLAVPNDIDADLAAVGDISLKNIDSFTSVAKAHNEQKKAGALQARNILGNELDETMKELLFHSKIDFVQRFGNRVKERNGMQLLYDMRRAATAEELRVLMGLWQRMNDDACESARIVQGEAV